ncbi:MAG: DUF3899 domain-containing protein [Oscillospiraceae bacterium]|nr:DUF3899 domain-containing protein [Oscillospiraceae bacterium]
MSKTLRGNLIKSAVALALGLVIAYAFVSLRVDMKNLSEVELVDLYLILCDAFTIPGLLMLMFGLLMTLSNHGALDGVGYLAVNAFKMLIPTAATKMERYKEYVERKRANRVKSHGFLYVVAAILLALAGIFMILFYSLYQK